MRWHRLGCACGGEWMWYGRPTEARFLARQWRAAHAGPGCRVLEGAA